MKHHWSALVSIVSRDSDGRTVQAQPAIKRGDIDQNGNETFVDHPLLVDQPVHFPGGGGVTLTHPVHAGDEILSIIASRPPETWMQSGGTQNPAYTRMHSISDGIAIASLRSTPRALQQISTATAQIRDDAKHHTLDHDPASGTHIKSVDPSTAPASATFDPFTSATTFYEHLVKGALGIVGSATNGGTTHSHGVNHDAGAFMSALNGLHQVMAHPTQGAVLSAENHSRRRSQLASCCHQRRNRSQRRRPSRWSLPQHDDLFRHIGALREDDVGQPQLRSPHRPQRQWHEPHAVWPGGR